MGTFAGFPPALVLAAPGGEEERWGRAFAGAHGSALELSAELGPPPTGQAPATRAEEVWRRLEARLAGGPAPLLVLLPTGLLQAVVARALSLPPHAAEALRVDPGRGVGLRDEALGIVLCRSNARGPAPRSGTALPDGRERAR